MFTSLYSLHTSTVSPPSPAFCLLGILRYICHFPLLPSACTPTRHVSRNRRQSLDFSIFAWRIAMRRGSLVRARRLGTTKCQNLLDLHASLRPGTRSYLVGLVGDEAQNFELRSFVSCTFPAPPHPIDPGTEVSRVQIMFRAS